jgi:asparagine synthase (glutamine-hydrolysing)
MCGICGFVGSSDRTVVQAMADTMAHRGPDGEGVVCFPAADGATPAALGHRRLSIIDPTPRGAQPMQYSDGRYWITYNGELYNFRGLRRELEQEGFKFASDCDTEVVLALYARHGAAMLSKMNGIFAFAIWDTVKSELFLARDRLGVKPLYYHHALDGSLYFASEVKALLAALPRPRLRHEVIGDFLTFLWVPDPDTIFDGIYKLPPGHCATLRDGRLRLSQYWDMTFAPEERSEKEWAGAIREAVFDAVHRQTIADVPLGSFLSGGIDSSAVVAALSKLSDPITTYTVGFTPEDLAHEIIPDDIRYSRIVAQEFGVDYREQILTPDVVGLLPQVIWHMDEPVADPAAITTYLICSAARNSLTVVLSGMGGDEVFAGYPRHLAARIGLATDAMPRLLRSTMRAGIEGRLSLGRPGRLRGPRRNLRKFVGGIDVTPQERYLRYASYYRPEQLTRLMSADMRNALGSRDPFEHHHTYFERVADEHWLNQLLYVDMKAFLPCLNLAYTDKMSMAASTEVRVPFLDDELVALSGRVPPDLKLRRLRRKYIFKRSMEGVLPKKVIWRSKAGFGAPIRSWLVRGLQPMLDDLLSPQRVAARGLFDVAEVQRLRQANEAGTEDNALRLWSLLTLELWQQQFIDQVPQPPARDPAYLLPS